MPLTSCGAAMAVHKPPAVLGPPGSSNAPPGVRIYLYRALMLVQLTLSTGVLCMPSMMKGRP